MKNVLVLFGGVSSEHDVSCVSASYVLENIPRESYTPYAVGITKEGEWFLYEGEAAHLPADGWLTAGPCAKAILSPDRADGGLLVFRGEAIEKIKIDICFPVLHGKYGEDGTIQGFLEIAGIPYVGCGTLSSAMCMDKAVTNMIADTINMQQARWLSLTENAYRKEQTAWLKKSAEYLQYPIFVKPANAGSSVGISKAHNEEELRSAIELALAHDKKVVLEAFINGFEVECAVIGNEEPMASAVGQIIPCNEFYDYEAKYEAESSLLIPADLPMDKQNEVRVAAVKIYKAMECRGLARVDFFVDKTNGAVIFNEINTIPGFTAISMYAKLLEQSGVPMPKLFDRLFKLAAEQ